MARRCKASAEPSWRQGGFSFTVWLMALAPGCFAPWELPDRGSVIRCAKKGGVPFYGVARLVWLALDTPCIDVAALLGQERTGLVRIYPELGDTWELVA